MDERLTIHPERAEVLVDVLTAAGRDLTERSHRLASLLCSHGEDLRPAVAIARTAATLLEGAVELHRVVCQVRAWEAGAGTDGRVVVLTSALAASHRSPEAAYTAARTIAASYRREGAGALAGIEQAWLDDPVFASTLLRLLGPDTVVGELALLGAAWTYPPSSIERREPAAVAAVLGALLALTTRVGPPALSADVLGRSATRLGVSPAVVGLLLVEPQPWEASYLASLVDEIVVPVSRQLIDRGVLDESPWFGSSGDAVDGRVLILSAVAAHEAAARLVVDAGDLEVLLDSRGDLLDGGASIGRLLVTATSPAAGTGIDALAPLVTRVVRTVVEIDERSSVPVGVHAELGALAAPWIGGFGSTDFTRFGVTQPLPALDDRTAARYLELAMGHERAATRLDTAVLLWARAALARADLTTEPLVVKHVADVLRAVGDASRAHHVARMGEADREAERIHEHVDLAMNVLTLPARTSPASEATTVVVVAGTSHLVEEVLPPTDRELRYLRGLPVVLAEDLWATQYLVAAVLWANRGHNGLFAPLVGPPVPGQADPPLGRSFLDDEGELAPYADLDSGARAAFEAWLYELDRSGATVAHLVNAAGAEYGGSAG